MIEFNFYPENNFILTVIYGDTSPEDLSGLIDQLEKIEHEQGGMRGLTILCKNSKAKKIKAADIMNAGERMRHVSFRKNGKNAIVAHTLLGYGLSRMYKVATDILNLDELKIYKENGLNDAIEWLAVEDLNEKIQVALKRCE